MRTRNAMQLKARINNKAKDAGIPPQALMQHYLSERFLERLSRSKWRNNIVVKGGILISSLIGIASRTTMDIDTTIRGFDLTHESVESVFREVAAIPSDDDWAFEFVRTEDIREADDYPGVRVHLKAAYPPMSIPLAIDVTTGDRITPSPAVYEYPLMFDEGSINLMAYPLETVLAEKLETVVSRGVANTRPRDFYDIHMLWRLCSERCSMETLRDVIGATCARRGSLFRMERWEQVVVEVEQDEAMLALWDRYARNSPYVLGISLQECCLTVREIMQAAL